jgi:putative transposase
MTRPLRLHVPGTLYHVMSRGNAKQRIFNGVADYDRFLRLLAQATERFRVECCAYCLMPNHFHAMLRPHNEPLSRMMHQLNSGYSQYFNRAHKRVGHVLQGRFKSLIVEGDDYFLTLLRYAMRNPVEARLVKVPSAWRWSSYRATAGLTRVPTYLELGSVWAMFDTTDIKRAQRRFIDYVSAPEGSVPSIESLFFGSRDFIEAMAPRLEPFRGDCELRYADRFAGRPPLSTLFANATDEWQRTLAIREAFFRYAYTLREIADIVRCHRGTVWRRLRVSPQQRLRTGRPPAERLLKRLRKLEA